jgi:Protein kinase domain
MNASPTLHPTDQTLHAYGLGKLDDASAESVNKHVLSCSDCQRRVAELSSDSFLGLLRGAQGRPDSPAPIMSRTDGLSMLAAGSGSPAPPPASTLPPGLADHPDYEILRELGRGGMGVVYLAQNKIMGRTEVLKVVGGHLINRRGVVDRFLAEIRNAARLRHPNIVTAYSVLRVGESLVLAMEHIEGLDLAKMVQARGPLPVAQACNYAHQAALGLQHAHEHGMVHRDIKPSNLMLTRQGNRALIKVLDFGLAKVQSEGAVDGGLTHEGQMLGTPDYVAPEQISDARWADIRADIYSLGCTLYYLLTGGPPFQGTSLYDILQAHHSMDAKPLNLARPEVPVELAALVAKMMAKEPERRFQEPMEVAQALLTFYRKGNAGAAGSKAEISRVGGADEGRVSTGVRTASTQPATNLAPAPAPSLKTPAATARPQPMWESLIELKENEPLEQSARSIAKPGRQKPLRLWSAVAGGMLLLGLVVAWGVILRVKTSNGTIELVNLPRDAEVFVDGEEVAVTWPGGGKPAVVTVTAGKHNVKVKKDGLETSGEEVTVHTGGTEEFTVRFVPLVVERQQKAKADARRANADEDPTPRVPPAVLEATAPGAPASRTGVQPSATKRLALFPAEVPWGGTWTISSNEVLARRTTGYTRVSLTPNARYENIVFEAEVKRIEGNGGIQLVLDDDNVGIGICFEIKIQNNFTKAYLTFWDPRARSFLPSPEPQWVGAVDNDKWDSLRMVTKDGVIKCYCNNKELISAKADGLRFRLHLTTIDVSARFRNIKVKDANGRVLLEGLPNLPIVEE